MNYLKKIYLNWFTLGLTIGIIPYVIGLIADGKEIKLNSMAYILLLLVPMLILIIFRKFKKGDLKNAKTRRII